MGSEAIAGFTADIARLGRITKDIEVLFRGLTAAAEVDDYRAQADALGRIHEASVEMAGCTRRLRDFMAGAAAIREMEGSRDGR